MGMANWIVASLCAVVAGVVIYILSAVNLQSQDRSISATQQRSVRTSQMDLVGMVEFDLRNIGSNFPPVGSEPFENDPDFAVVAFDTSANTKYFQFIGQTERWVSPDTIRYEWSSSGTVEVKRDGASETVDAYTVRRLVNGNVAGSSSGIVTRFQIALLSSDGTPAATLTEARQIEVNIRMVSNLGASKLVGETDWTSIVRPAALARNDYLDYL